MVKDRLAKRMLLCAILSGLLLSLHQGAARADELSDLKQQLEAQQKVLQQMQERLAQLEARQKAEQESLDKKIDEVAEKVVAKPADEKPAALPDNLKWLEKIKISGDLRYRHEHVDQENAAAARWSDGRDRHRIRARLMLEAIINDEWGLGFRIASGSASPTSTNQTLDSGFSSKDVWLDLAYFDWHPAAVSGLNVYGGKIKNPFYNVGGNQLIWDGDLNFEGLAATYRIPLGQSDSLGIAAGGFWVDENSGIDTSLFGGQLYWQHKMENSDTFTLGTSYYDYGNIKGMANLPSLYGGGTSYMGNTSSGGAYASDYDILEIFGEYATEVAELPFSLYGNWVKNLVAGTNEDQGWLVGAKIGKAKDPGSWQFAYNYRDLDADAVIGTFSDSDFIGGGTDGKGHVISGDYQVAKNVQLGLNWFINEDRANTQGRDLDYNMVQADLKFKF